MEMNVTSAQPSTRPHGHEVVTVLGPGDTLDPKKDPGLRSEQVRELYKALIRTRMIDERVVLLQRQGRIGFHVGSMGEEVSIVASAAALRAQDWIFPCYREFGALLYRGFPLQQYIDNLFGNANDPVLGRQMPDHYVSYKLHYASVSSPVGTQIPQAVGVAWAAKMKKDDVVASVFFGEGATSSSDFHAGLNLAGVFKLPVVFLCRNNHWAISVPPEKQTATATFAEKGAAYGVRSVRCDGNDVFAVYRTVKEAVELAAKGQSATLIELLTYRLSGHSTSDDPKAYRSDADLAEWQKRDPLARTRRYLESVKAWSEADETAWRHEVEQEIKACVMEAEETPKPELSTMFQHVYAEQPAHLAEQAAQCIDGPRAKAGH